MTDTIFALSSGQPPAAIAVIRVSGPQAMAVAQALAGAAPPPRRATLRTLRGANGSTLDHALVLFFPGPHTATGEDLLELHCHGGRAVVAAVLDAIGSIQGLRLAEAGEFTRRALENGVVDLAQAEGLADLLEAETQEARIAALAAAEGVVSLCLRGWSDTLAGIRAEVEATLDYADEADVETAATLDHVRQRISLLAQEIGAALDQPSVERLRDGPVVVLAGPRNAGKSSLFNALLGRDAAIVSPIAGTTRDVIEAQVQRMGQPLRLIDTAGLTDATDDVVERVGIERAAAIISTADIVLWLGSEEDRPAGALLIHARCDERQSPAPAGAIATSIHDAAAIAALWSAIMVQVDALLCRPAVPLRERQRRACRTCRSELIGASSSDDEIIIAEQLRLAATALDEALGRDPTHALLDALFSRFCVGK